MRVEGKVSRLPMGENRTGDPAVERERAYRTALALLPRMSPVSLPRMIRMAGGAEELWETLCRGGERAVALAGGERAGEWKEACRRTDPQRSLDGLVRRGIRVVLPGEDAVPEVLWRIYDPPALLFARGRELPRNAVCVAVVGARKATSYGRRCAEHLAAALAGRGVVVVSGAAYGIDAHAHRGSLQAGGFTVAVLGCGIDRVYPPEHAGLLARIAESGCLLSEYPPGEEPQPWKFPHRNRIIAGLSLAVVVVEASARSGALITADLALEEGREVMAVPGPIGHPLTEGTHSLIKKGAKLVTGVEDILEELPVEALRQLERGKEGRAAGEADSLEGWPPLSSMSPHERAVIAVLGQEPGTLDLISLRTGVEPHELLATLASLLIKGWVRQDAGGRYCLSPFPPQGPFG
ncbi:DNA-processing protein DprA [Candidatus Solincola tengchongensis]|uniref:DNA-processing protein DprA n=1 Tax=Candidatus Solincola tengchongensis TaxID=2900693 RepID=UPI00257E4239|nr:DNA-processing protein DprA [Candidatus Solincola tengchongensis]